MSEVTFHVADGSVLTTRALEVPTGGFDAGCNLTASNASGIGIGIGVPNLVGTSEQFTLLDQDGDARVPQLSQVIGGVGLTTSSDWPLSGGVEGKATLPIEAGTVTDAGDGDVTAVGLAQLAALATGWAKNVI